MSRKNGQGAGNPRGIEALESRLFLSVAHAAAKGGPGGAAGPAIRLDLVALHEFGHSLGLDHNDASAPGSIMNAYYNPNYDVNSFANDAAVTTLRSLFADVNASPWKDSLDPIPGNGVVDITYSFVPDGTRMDQGKSNLFAKFNALASTDAWQKVFTDQLDRWAAASEGKISFQLHSDAGLPSNYAGAAQNDSNSGDIRIGGHAFDGAGKVLGHTYFPPPNGRTVAGDSHYDTAENWVLAGAGGAATVVAAGTGGSSSSTLFYSSGASRFSAGPVISTDDVEGSDGDNDLLA
jgi:Matrixin